MPCQEQEEYRTLTWCREHLSTRAARETFVLTSDRLRRYEGVWHLERKLLFPKYVFLESDYETALAEELRKHNVPDVQQNHLHILSREEEDFLKRLCGVSHHMKMSRGVITRGIPRITEGPLKGMENRICRIDRHKRLARLWTAVNQERCMISAGLEITEKN